DFRSFVERQPAPQALGLARRTIGKLRVGMQARAGGVSPGPVARLPRRDDPAVSGLIAYGDVRLREEFVVVRLLLETGGSFEHYAVLHAQIGKRLFCTVRQPELHLDGVAGRNDFRTEDNSVG